ncbi:MAG: hypothetical protein ABGZ23_30980, partial [Fuerstiella sp.]
FAFCLFLDTDLNTDSQKLRLSATAYLRWDVSTGASRPGNLPGAAAPCVETNISLISSFVLAEGFEYAPE